MCIEDIRLGRLTKSFATSFSLTNATTKPFNSNQQRIALGVAIAGGTLSTGNEVFLTFGNGAVVTLNQAMPTYRMTLQDWHDTVLQSCVISTTETVLTVTITETVLPETALQEALEWLNRQYKPKPAYQ